GVDATGAPVAPAAAPHGVDADAVPYPPPMGLRGVNDLTSHLVPAVWRLVHRFRRPIGVHLTAAEPRGPHPHHHPARCRFRIRHMDHFHPFSAQHSYRLHHRTSRCFATTRFPRLASITGFHCKPSVPPLSTVSLLRGRPATADAEVAGPSNSSGA